MGVAGIGSLKTRRAVRSSGVSTRWRPWSWLRKRAFTCGFTMFSRVNFTSAAVKGFPSCHLTPGRSLNSQTRPSSVVFHDAARSPTGLPSPGW